MLQRATKGRNNSILLVVLILLGLTNTTFAAKTIDKIEVDPAFCAKTNCITAIQSFIRDSDALEKHIIFKKGKYSFDARIVVNKSNVKIYSEGEAEIEFTNPKRGGFLIGYGSSETISGLTLEDLKITFSRKEYLDTEGHGIDIINCKNCTIRNVSVTNASGHGVRLHNSTDCWFESLNLKDNSKFGLAITGSTSNITINSVKANNNGKFDLGKDKRFSNICIGDNVRKVSIKNIQSFDAGRDGLALGNNPKKNESGPVDVTIENLEAGRNMDHGLEMLCAKQVTAGNIKVYNNGKNGIGIYDDPDGCFAEDIKIDDLQSYDNKFSGVHIVGAKNITLTTIKKLKGVGRGDVKITHGYFRGNKAENIKIGNKIFREIKDQLIFNWE